MNVKNKIWGVALVLLAGIYVMSQFLPVMPDISLFKLFITVVLVTIIVPNIPKLNFSGVLIPCALIIWLYSDELSDLFFIGDISGWGIMLAAVIASIGFDMIFADVKRKRRKEKLDRIKEKVADDIKSKTGYYNSDDVIDGHGVEIDEEGNPIHNGNAERKDFVHAEVTFASATKYVDANDFRTGDFECNFGTLKVYFDKATINGDRADVEIGNHFGNTILYVPRNWKVNSSIDCVAGSYREHGECTSNAPIIYLKGESVFGNVDLYYI